MYDKCNEWEVDFINDVSAVLEGGSHLTDKQKDKIVDIYDKIYE